MTNKFNKGFKPSTPTVDDNAPKKEVVFKRDESDNKIFKKYQVNDIEALMTEDCIAYYDADTLYYTAAQNQETKFITVTHKVEGWSEELSGVKVFKGLGNGIKVGSWLHAKNIDREVEGLPLYMVEDFEVEAGQRLKGDEAYCLEQAKMQIYMKLKRVRLQFKLPKIITVIGKGDTFRNSLPLCRPYKGNRAKVLKPLLLGKLREWGVEELNAITDPRSKLHGNLEVDDFVDIKGYEGYLHYTKTGKFNKVSILSDKDGYNAPKLLCNPDTHSGDHPQKGKFKYPQPTLVPNASEDCGDIETLVKEKSVGYKFIGFKGLLWQILTFDGADGYNSLGHLNGGMGFGADSAYKVLKPCTSAKEALEGMIAAFAQVLPYGVQYTSHDGVERDVPTMAYINTYFRVAYMLRNLNDNMDFYKLCKMFKVDTSAIDDNNKLTHPIKTFVGDEEHLNEVGALITSILKEDMKGLKQMKKADQGAILDKIKEKLLSIDFESHYEMRQFDKGL